MQFTNEHVNCRVAYTTRNGVQHLGTLREVEISIKMCKIELDSSYGLCRWVPQDALMLVQEPPSDATGRR